MGGGKKVIDWEEMKRQFVTGNPIESLNEFRKRNHIGNCNQFYSRVKKEKWSFERNKFQNQITRKVEANALKAGVEQWDRQIRLWMKLEDQVEKLLDKHVARNGRLVGVKDMDPQAIRALALTLESSVRSHKLMRNEPIDGTGGGTTVNFHVQVANLTKEIEAKADGPILLEPPE